MPLKTKLALAVMVVFLSAQGLPQDRRESPQSNLDILRSLAHAMGTGLSSEVLRGSVFLTVLPAESAWYIETGLRQAFIDGGLSLMSRDSADIALEIGLRDSRITYDNVRRRSVFGERIADRRVELTLTAKAVRQSEGTVIINRDVSSSLLDTVALADIERLENSALPITKGSMAPQGFFGNIVEPVVALGALGIAIYLLFNVRS